MTGKLNDILKSLFPPRSMEEPCLDNRVRSALALAVMAACLMMSWIVGYWSSGQENVPPIDATINILIALIAGWMVFRMGYYFRRQALSAAVFLSFAIVLGVLVRLMSLHVETLDYQNFLKPWTNNFRIEGWDGFQSDKSNYNMPYLYLLAIIARLPLNDLFLIKLVSIFFDFAIVLAMLRLARHFSFGPLRTAALGAATFLAPTVWLNGAFWGQCDVIYGFFVLMCLIYVLEKRAGMSFVMAALAFSFKLQAVFFLPAYLVFWMARKVRWKQFFVFPAVYLASVLPAWFLGKSWGQIIGVYFDQAGSSVEHEVLNYNSPSAFALVWFGEDKSMASIFAKAGIIGAVLLIALVCFIAWQRRDVLSDKALVVMSLCMVLGIPWLLPYMHERYFFLADILFLAVAFLYPRFWYFAPLGIFCSYAGYHAYIFKKYIYFITVSIPALILLMLLCRALMLFYQSSRELPEVKQKSLAKK